MLRLVREKKALYDPILAGSRKNRREEGKIIAQRLGEIDPKNKERYQANAQKLESVVRTWCPLPAF